MDREALPPEEWQAAEYIEGNLRSLQRGAEAFRYTVEFYMHIRELVRTESIDTWRKVAWTRMAGRDGAIEAYSFNMVMELINDWRRRAPTPWGRMDKAKMKVATGLFAKEFPNIAGVRNSAAHPGQLSGSPEEIARHRLGGIGIFIGDSMSASDDALHFGSTYKQRPVEYELSYAKADALAKVACLYNEAFWPLEHPTEAAHRELRRQIAEQRGID